MLDTLWHEWTAWWAALAPEFVFLLALPFAVAALGLLRAWLGRPPRS